MDVERGHQRLVEFEECYQRITQAVRANQLAHKAHVEVLKAANQKRSEKTRHSAQEREAFLQQAAQERDAEIELSERIRQGLLRIADQKREAAELAAAQRRDAALEEANEQWEQCQKLRRKARFTMHTLQVFAWKVSLSPSSTLPASEGTVRDRWLQAFQRVLAASEAFSEAVQAFDEAQQRKAVLRRVFVEGILLGLGVLGIIIMI